MYVWHKTVIAEKETDLLGATGHDGLPWTAEITEITPLFSSWLICLKCLRLKQSDGCCVYVSIQCLFRHADFLVYSFMMRETFDESRPASLRGAPCVCLSLGLTGLFTGLGTPCIPVTMDRVNGGLCVWHGVCWNVSSKCSCCELFVYMAWMMEFVEMYVNVVVVNCLYIWHEWWSLFKCM